MDYLSAYFSIFSWQDIVDIALNSYILFRLYVLFRKTNAFRVLIGIALLWFFQRISASMGLIVTTWAIQGVTAAAAIIIIVIFRDEIRSVLQARNLKAILWGIHPKTALTPIEVIVESVFELSKKHTGALLVLANIEDLKEVIHGGTPWKGEISKEMILSIFWPDNPVHDGAAIIQGSWIEEVGVILPLTRRKDLPSYYGTRHRAAIGLTERTDALVVLVSEESGNVLVAQSGRIRVVNRKGQLAEVLQEHEGLTPSNGWQFKKEKLEMMVAGLVSVIFIFGIWVSFSRGLESLTTVDVPIEYMNRDPRKVIMETSENTVRLHLAGSGTLIKSLRPEQVKIKLDLSNGIVGPNTYTVTSKNITLPPGVFLKKVEQPDIKVTLDVPIVMELPIQVDWTGKLPHHLMLKNVTVKPSTIEVEGGSQIFKNISTIYTEKVSLSNIKQSGSLVANIILSPASLKIAPGSKDKVTVYYEVTDRK
jgi:uncharacterized protein (TIGR00159 family)